MKSLWSQVKKLKGMPSVYLRKGWYEDAQRVLPESFLTVNLLTENPELKGYVEGFYQLIDQTVRELKRARSTEALKDISYNLPRFLVVGDVDDALEYIEELGRFPPGLRERAIELLARMSEEYPRVREKGILVEGKMDNPCILVRLLAAGLYSEDRLMLRQVAEVFDVERLQSLTENEPRRGMDKSIHFLYLGLADRKFSGFQGNKRAAREILNVFEERYGHDEYMRDCIEKLRRYF
jgi:hypothetical protein